MRQAAGGGADSRNDARRRDRGGPRRLLEHAAAVGAGVDAVAAGTRARRAPRPAPIRDDLGAATIERPRARWVAVRWSDLPGWDGDRLADFWAALMRSCERPAPAWLDACAKARQLGVERRQRRSRRASGCSGSFGRTASSRSSAIRSASRPATSSRSSRPRACRGPAFASPCTRPPADLASRSPYWTRQQLETLPAAQKSLQGREIAWVRDRLDALLLQVQGSGRLVFASERGGAPTIVRVAYAAHNDQPYDRSAAGSSTRASCARAKRRGRRSAPGRGRTRRRVDEMLRSNPRVVFFREEPLPDPGVGPKGAQGVPLSPGRSIAVDPQSVPYGTPVWLDTTEPLATTAAAPPRRRPGHRLGDRRRRARRLLLGLGRRRRGGRRPHEAAAADVGAVAGRAA